MDKHKWQNGRVDDVVMLVIDADITELANNSRLPLVLERRVPAPFKKNPAAEGSDGGVLIRLCHYIRGQKHWRCSQRLGGAQIFRGRFASPAIRDDVRKKPSAPR